MSNMKEITAKFYLGCTSFANGISKDIDVLTDVQDLTFEEAMQLADDENNMMYPDDAYIRFFSKDVIDSSGEFCELVPEFDAYGEVIDLVAA